MVSVSSVSLFAYIINQSFKPSGWLQKAQLLISNPEGRRLRAFEEMLAKRSEVRLQWSARELGSQGWFPPP
jgi:hypothetical protein